ncbi:MAG: hypothetical protein VXZ19_03110, partial [Pseudomonadota bacterium]|nr:hypothetical protein [Pseudomonadota bacterium]
MGAERPKTPTTQTGVELAKPNTPPTQEKVALPSQPGAGPNASALVNRQVPGSDSEGVKTLLESIAIQT